MDITVNFALLNVWGWVYLALTGISLFFVIPIALRPRKPIEAATNSGAAGLAGLLGLLFVGILLLPMLLAIQWPLNGWGWALILYTLLIYVVAFVWSIVGRPGRDGREGWDAAFVVLIVLLRATAVATVFLFAAGVLS